MSQFARDVFAILAFAAFVGGVAGLLALVWLQVEGADLRALNRGCRARRALYRLWLRNSEEVDHAS